MNENRIHESIVHRILSGKFLFIYEDITYELRKPSLELKMEADLLYFTAYEENIYNEDFIFAEDIDDMLIKLDILYFNYQKDLGRIEKSLDRHKIELYQQFFDKIKRDKIKNKIKNIKADIEDIYNKKHSLDHLTLEHHCDNIKNEFIISNTLYYFGSDKLVFNKNASIDYTKFNALVSKISKNIIDIATYKKIARSDYWKNYWNNNKTNVLNEPVKEWSEEQKSLINISSMYDRIYEHPECPKDDIISDDDALDGWMLYQKQENEKQKAEKGVDSMLSDKVKNSAEVFLMAANRNQAQDILGLNSDTTLGKIKQKVDTVLAKGQIKDSELPDVKAKIMQQLQDKG